LKWTITRVRRDVDCLLFKNFIKYEKADLSLQYIDESNKHIGGKIKSHSKEFNISHFKPYDYFTYGFFNNDKLVLGKFRDNGDKFNDENALFDVTKGNIENTNLISRHSYEIDSKGLIYYKVEVNPILSDLSHEEIENSHTELLPKTSLNFRELTYHYLP
jgi:hypothetical protein